MESQGKYEEKKILRDDQEQSLADIMGLTLDEYREIGCQASTDADGSLKVYWSASGQDSIVAKIKGRQAIDDDHVTITQDLSQLGDPY